MLVAANVLRAWLISLVEVCSRAARLVVILATVATLSMGYYTLTHLTLDTNNMNMLDPELPFRKLKLDFERAFPQFHNLLVMVIEANTIHRAREISDQLTMKLRQEPAIFDSIYQPGQGPFFSRNGLLYLDTDDLWDVDQQLSEAEPFLGTLYRDPSLRGLFSGLGRAFDDELSPHHQTLLIRVFNGISDTIEAQFAGRPSGSFWDDQFLDLDGALGQDHRSFVLVQPRLDYTSLQAGGDAISRIRALAHDLEREAEAGVRIRLTGSVAMGDEELASVKRGAGAATVMSVGLVWLLLHVGLRSARLVFSILLTLGMGLIWTAAFATLTIGHLNVISVTFPVLFIGLGVDFGIQFGMRYREEFHGGSSHALALNRAASGVGGALTLAATAAAISFFSFVPTPYRGFAEMGVIAGGGMYIALFANLTVLPAFLTLMPLTRTRNRAARGVLTSLNAAMINHRRITLLATLLAVLGSLVLLPRAEFDFNPVNLKDPTSEAVVTFKDLLQDPDSTPYTLSVLRDDLASAETLAAELQDLEEVDKTVTLASFVPKDQEEKLAIIDDMNLVLQPLAMPVSYVSPPTLNDQVQAISDFRRKINHVSEDFPQATEAFSASAGRLTHLLTGLAESPRWPGSAIGELEGRLLSGLSQSLGELQDLLMAAPVTIADLPEDLRRRYLAEDGRARIQVFPEKDLGDNQNLRAFVRSVQAMAPNVTDTAASMLEGGNAVVQACLMATGITLVVSVLLLLRVLSSLRDTLLVLLPLLVAFVLTVASSVLLDVPINLANLIALPLLLGLGIAFGIYLVLRTRSGLDLRSLFQSSTPRAVLFSALTTIGSFGTLAFSDHMGLSSIGILLTLSLSFALLCTLLVLPSVLAELEARRC